MIFSTGTRGVAALGLTCLALAGCSSSSSGSSTPTAATTAAATTAGAATSSTEPSATDTPTASTASPTSTTAAAPTTRTATKKPASSASSSAKPFRVTLPSGYKSDPARASGAVVAFYAGPVVSRFTVNVNVTRETAPGVSVKEVERQAAANIKKVIKISNFEGPAALKVDGESALSYTFEDTQSGYKLKQGQVVVVHSGYAYVITFTAPVAQFDKQRPKAEQLVNSFKFS